MTPTPALDLTTSLRGDFAPLAPDSFLWRHLLVADPAPLSFKTRGGGGGGLGGVAYKDRARPPPPPVATPRGLVWVENCMGRKEIHSLEGRPMWTRVLMWEILENVPVG